jgi:hypothetical protein
MEMYDDSNTFEKTFNTSYLSEYLLQAQWAELIELKKVITELYHYFKQPIAILDIGIGNARVAKHLSGIKEIWNQIEHYDGIDNVQSCALLSQQVIQEHGLVNKVSVHWFDAAKLQKWTKKYHLIITTWFTAGNFYPDDFQFESYGTGTEKLDLTKNEKFTRIFSGAYQLLHSGGEIVIGSCYLDNDATRKKQEDFYKKIGMTAITSPRDSFTATKERFWSQRFTPERIKQYLPFVPRQNIQCTLLDTYDYAMQVRLKK